MQAVIGALRAVLGLDTKSFEKGIGEATKQLNGLARQFEGFARRMDATGKTLSMALTAPILAAKGVALAQASSFEAAMNRVQVATQASTQEFQRLEAMARKLGPTSGGATQVATAMEALAKNGLDVTRILEGAAVAAVNLSMATGGDRAKSADVVTDVMGNFRKQASQLGEVVDQVTGTMLVSKFGFEDYKLAIGQAGGVAGQLGVSFEEFNAVLAATSTAFASGSDAGTSFKTFLTRLVPGSKEAEEVMRRLGLSFFDAQGKMLAMPEIAERLKQAFAGLTDQQRNADLTKLFGTDSMRTALMLISQGGDGVRKLMADIARVSAADQAAVRIKGFGGAIDKLKGSIEGLSIAIGRSGLLEWATRAVEGVTRIVDRLAALDPALLRTGTVAAGIAAAFGPLLLVLGKVAEAVGSSLRVIARLAPALAPLAAAALPFIGWAVAIGTVVGALLVFQDEIDVAGGGTITLGDYIRSLTARFGELQSALKSLSLSDTWLGRITRGLGDFVSNPRWRNMAQEFVDLMDRVQGTIAGLVLGGLALIHTFPEAMSDILTRAGNVVQQWITTLLNIVIRGINSILEYFGRTPIPELPVTQWVNKHEGAFEEAGRRIAASFMAGFNSRTIQGWIDGVQRGAEAASAERRLAGLPAPDAPPPVGPRDFGLPQWGGKTTTKTPPGLPPFGGGGRDRQTVREYIEELRREAEAERLSAEAKEVATAIQKAENIAKESGRKLTADERVEIEKAVALRQANNREQAEQVRLNELAKRTIEEGLTPLERYNKAIEDLNLLLASGRITQDQWIRGRQHLDRELSRSTEDFGYAMERLSDAIGDAAKDTARELLRMDGDWKDVLKRMYQRFSEFALQILLFEPLFKQLGDTLKGVVDGTGGSGGSSGGGILGLFNRLLGGGGGIGNFFGGGGGTLGSLSGGEAAGATSFLNAAGGTGGFFASGGRPPLRMASIVGELGPELFVPDTLGRIFSHAELREIMGEAGSGPVVNTSNVIFNVATPDTAGFRRSERQMARRAREKLGR